jgi:predicted transcriptional regulator
MARRLRREQGLSIKEIEKRLGVSRSSVSIWVRDIELTPAQHARLLRQNPAHNRQRAGHAAWSALRREQRLRCQEHGRRLARRADAFHAAGCMLFWAEGAKERDSVHLANSDPEMLRFFIAFLRRYYAVPDAKFRVRCNLFADHLERQRDVEDHWLDAVDLPRSCLIRSTVNTYSRHSQRKRLNMLPYGTCRLTVNSVDVAQSLFGAIQEYGGFERPEWLG